MTDKTGNKQLRILLIDDDIDFVDSMSGILELEGYPVTTAHSGSEAISRLESFGPDVALVDIRIGKESGLDLVGKLQEVMPELTCVVVTAYSDTETAIEALKRGVYDYLRKPFETADLFAVLRRCADRLRLLAEKKESDLAREESDIRFKVAFDTSPDAIILAYPGGKIIDVNTSFEAMTGYRRDKVVGLNSKEVGLWKNPDDRASLLEQLKEFGSANNMEADFRLSDGRIRRGLVSARVVQLAGEQVGLFVVRDIHDIRIKESAILESEERFRGLVSNIPGAVYRCYLDKDWTMQYISSPIRDISGYDATDFVQNKVRSFASIIYPDDSDNVAQVVTHAVSQKKPFSIEYRIVHSDGSVRWVHERGLGVFGQTGAVECIDGVIFDMTENRKALDELATSEKRLRDISREYSTVLEGIPDAILLIDRNLKIVWGNVGASQHFSIPQDELPGIDCAEVWDCQTENCVGCLQRVFKQSTPLEVIQKTSDGRVWGVKVFPIRSDQDEVVNVVQIASDMTEKTRLRDQAARSAHLAALGELAAGVAHEINNPTGMILLDIPMLKDALSDLMPLLEENCDILKKEKIGGLSFERFRQEAPLVIDEIYEGAQRIKRIVEELKNFSKPAVGGQGSIDLNEVATKAISLVRNPLKNVTDNFLEDYADRPLIVSGNAQRLEQVVVNLVLNACYALESRSAGIQIKTVLCEDSSCAQIIVKDEGIGIEPEVLKQITDPFFTTRRESGGTGLGLSVSSRIVDEHNGTMTFDSEPGRGTTVVLELPTVDKVSLDE